MQVQIEDITQPPNIDDVIQVQFKHISQPPNIDDVMHVQIDDITQPPRTDDVIQVQIDDITQPPRTDDVPQVRNDSTIIEEIQQEQNTAKNEVDKETVEAFLKNSFDNLMNNRGDPAYYETSIQKKQKVDLPNHEENVDTLSTID
ncbi:hypothetical protein LINGRAHAP2_LOCUS15152 [Linum grandiflorum]